jgi:hypothetical protein
MINNCSFGVQVPPIGPIRRVLVEREKASCTATGDGWFLEAVVVHGPNGEHYSFPCNAWFGHSDCGDYEGRPWQQQQQGRCMQQVEQQQRRKP